MRKANLLAAALLFAAAPAAAERLTLYSLATSDRFVEFGCEGGVGDMILWNSELQDAQGNKVGTDTGSCIRVDAAGDHLCNIVIDHESHGKMNLNGVQLTEPQISTLTILGGTGDYEGATGVIRSTPVEVRARFRTRSTIGSIEGAAMWLGRRRFPGARRTGPPNRIYPRGGGPPWLDGSVGSCSRPPPARRSATPRMPTR